MRGADPLFAAIAVKGRQKGRRLLTFPTGRYIMDTENNVKEASLWFCSITSEG